MGDSLRARIAAVLFSHNAGDDWNMEPLLWEEISESYRECWLKQADAVIAELYPRRRCRLCGREGTQKFFPYRDGWVCRSVHACEMRRRNNKSEDVNDE